MRPDLHAAQVAELAERFEDWSCRAGMVDEVLDAAAEHRGKALLLVEPRGAERS